MLLPDRRCGASLLVSPVLDRLPRVRHGFTTRMLGDASGHPPGGPALDAALEGPEGPAGSWSRHGLAQVHGTDVATAGAPTASEAPPAADALIATERGQALVIRTADCVPILLAAWGVGGIQAVGAVHAGWRGLAAGVVPAAAAALRDAAPSARMVAALGPCIGACCFDVGSDVARELDALGGDALLGGSDGRSRVDLARLARFQLAASGVAVPDDASPPCTRCHPELFFSHRGEGAAAGRLASFIGLLPQ